MKLKPIVIFTVCFLCIFGISISIYFILIYDDSSVNLEINGPLSSSMAINEFEYSINDLDFSYSTLTSSVLLDLKESSVDGINFKDGNLYISKGGEYILSGELDKGSIIIDVGNIDVRLLFNGVTVTSDGLPSVYVVSCDKLTITMNIYTDNVLNDSVYDTYDDSVNSVIYSKNDIVINGNGSLTINASNGYGIKSSDELVITGCSVIINSLNDSLVGKDSVILYLTDITINSLEKGIISDNDNAARKGWVLIDGGNVSIDSKSHSIKAETYIQINNGILNLISEKDGLNSTGDVKVVDGIINIDVQDDGIHSDGDIYIEDGSINISDSYEGIEGSTITFDNGKIVIHAFEDGINSTGKDINDGFIMNNGYLFISSGGDSIDSTNNIFIYDGVVSLDGPGSEGPKSGNDSNIDVENGQFIFNGSTIFAVGGDAEQAIASITEVPLVYISFDEFEVGSGYIVISSVTDDILAFKPTRDFASILIGSNDFNLNEKYTVYFCDNCIGDTIDNVLYTNVTCTSKTSVLDFVFTEKIIVIDEAGKVID